MIANDREGYIKCLIKATVMSESRVKLPETDFRFLGKIILLRRPEPSGTMKEIAGEAYELKPDELNQLPFGDLHAHEMKIYYAQWIHACEEVLPRRVTMYF